MNWIASNLTCGLNRPTTQCHILRCLEVLVLSRSSKQTVSNHDKINVSIVNAKNNAWITVFRCWEINPAARSMVKMIGEPHIDRIVSEWNQWRQSDVSSINSCLTDARSFLDKIICVPNILATVILTIERLPRQLCYCWSHRDQGQILNSSRFWIENKIKYFLTY